MPVKCFVNEATYFSGILKQWIPNICNSDQSKPLSEQGLVPELQRAVIAVNGALTPSF